jgi:hypothetical protein
MLQRNAKRRKLVSLAICISMIINFLDSSDHKYSTHTILDLNKMFVLPVC